MASESMKPGGLEFFMEMSELEALLKKSAAITFWESQQVCQRVYSFSCNMHRRFS